MAQQNCPIAHPHAASRLGERRGIGGIRDEELVSNRMLLSKDIVPSRRAERAVGATPAQAVDPGKNKTKNNYPFWGTKPEPVSPTTVKAGNHGIPGPTPFGLRRLLGLYLGKGWSAYLAQPGVPAASYLPACSCLREAELSTHIHQSFQTSLIRKEFVL